ncbi:MAG TPA: response regulator, partial [Blastocatellia bacterium]
IVDDNATNRRILEIMLSGWKMRPTPVADGVTALAVLGQAISDRDPFRLILVDSHMPGMDGFTLVKRIRETPTPMKAVVMMLTSGPQFGDTSRCRESGIGACLTKPVSQSELLRSILKLTDASVTARDLSRTRTVPSGIFKSPQTGSLKILLAEDNLVNQKLAVGMLTKAGYAVSVAKNGREVLDFLERRMPPGETPFDLILMDVQMPEMDGLEATRAIRDEEQITGAHLPIVAMTAHAMKGDAERCLKAGMDAYISKPISANMLLETIERITSPQIELARGGPGLYSRPAVDVVELARTSGVDPELLMEAAGLFVADYPRLMGDLHEALARGDTRAMQGSAHSIKGAVANFGAQTAVNAAEKIENLAESGDLGLAREAIAELGTELDRLSQALVEVSA